MKTGNHGIVVTLVRKSIPQTPLDSEPACDGNCEVVVTQVKIGVTIVEVFKVYIRPNVDENEESWVRKLVDPKIPMILAGDFIKHTAWCYESKEQRGREIKLP